MPDPSSRPHSPALILIGLAACVTVLAAVAYGYRLYAKDQKQAKLSRIATAISRGEYESARTLISAGLVDETDPRLISELFLQRANLRLYSKEPDWLPEAAKDATKAVNADPSNLSALRYHGLYAQMLGERYQELTPKEAASFFKTAVEDYSTVIGRDPTDYRNWIGRAKAYRSLGETKKAADDCRHAVQLDPAARAEAHSILPGEF
jgi:tetratricopeptide (TPR) repeat protein